MLVSSCVEAKNYLSEGNDWFHILEYPVVNTASDLACCTSELPLPAPHLALFAHMLSTCLQEQQMDDDLSSNHTSSQQLAR